MMTFMDTTTATDPKQTAANIRADLEIRPTLDTTAERLRAHGAAVNVLRANGVTRDFVVAAVPS